MDWLPSTPRILAGRRLFRLIFVSDHDDTVVGFGSCVASGEWSFVVTTCDVANGNGRSRGPGSCRPESDGG